MSPKAERAKMLLDDFDIFIEKALTDYQVPGLAIGVVVDGHVVYSKGFGVCDLDTRAPVTPETLFAMGSCTKAFTTFVIGNMVEEGKMGWDDRVIDILPEFRLWDQYATTNVTLRDLLTHRTGMPRHEFAWYNAKISREEMMRRIRFLQPSFDIRQRYQYGNLMYFIAGLALEKSAGVSLERLIQDRILSPLKMESTNFSISDMQKSKSFASPYIEKNDVLKKMPFRDLSLISAAGGMNSNVEDMTHWLNMLIGGGVYKNRVLINPATLQELYAPQVIIPGAPESKESLLYAYGIGWGVISYHGHYFVSHDGVSDGFTSVAGFLPQERIGIVVCSNKNMTSLPRYVSFQIIDKLLGLPYHDWFQEGVESIRKNKQALKERIIKDDLSRKMGTMPSHALQEYAGIYEHPGYGKLEITYQDGKLEVHYNDLIFGLDHWHYDVFRVAEERQDMVISIEGTKLTFCNNANGEIGELIIPFEPLADDIIFKRKMEEKLSTLTYLRQFTGIYEIYGYTVEIVVRNHALVAIIPGQPNYELIPIAENEFTVKAGPGSTVRFIMNSANQVDEILLIQPYGAFTARPRR
ncbi:MAG: beta-lactamase family protein [Verrucomicrobia bacterium]|nr:beta-lactamase family protein [Verrucomicrobiota bacterium]MBU6446305.1 beta-lactamase family protein [Verrucomicrobiota bacterium]MDE3046887.1 serine hydrolase [Verrucomicrobiota bacterium]